VQEVYRLYFTMTGLPTPPAAPAGLSNGQITEGMFQFSPRLLGRIAKEKIARRGADK
jgi:hypothetical protein